MANYTGQQPAVGAYNPGGAFSVSSGYPTRNNGTDPHYGVDFSATRGTDIPAAAAGIVVNTRYSTSYGNCITVMHKGVDGSTFYTFYAHMNAQSPLRVGAEVQAGQTLGVVGSSGVPNNPAYPIGVHLHFEVRTTAALGGSVANTVDPLTFTNYGGAPTITTGLSPTAIPGQASGPGTPFKEITNGTETVRIYDNGVTYMINHTTGTQDWRIPNQTTGGSQDIMQLSNGYLVVTEVSADGVSLSESIYSSTGQLIANRPLFNVDTSGTSPTPLVTNNLSSLNYNDLSSIDKTLNQMYGSGSVGSSLYNNFNDYYSNYLLTPSLTQQAITNGLSGLNLNPIGAFYESVTPALDTAPSIAAKTGVLLGANNAGQTVASLIARDLNLDGQLTGTELAGLSRWADLNENGTLDANELQTLAQQGITQIKSTDYGFYTQGNAVASAAMVAAPVRPNEAVGMPAAIVAPATPAQPARVNLVQAVPASNYATLRATDNTYVYTAGGYIYVINWAPTQIKVNSLNKTYLIDTDGADSFDANYYAATPSYIINSGLLTNFLAGGGNDTFGGSTRADTLWGGTGNDTAYGYAGDDKLYGEEGNDILVGQDGNDYMDGGIGDDQIYGGLGNDVGHGGDGNDLVSGNEGDDTVYGAAGLDTLYGGIGNDYLDGGAFVKRRAANDGVFDMRRVG